MQNANSNEEWENADRAIFEANEWLTNATTRFAAAEAEQTAAESDFGTLEADLAIQ